jgi:hypothetical protein
LLVTKGHTEVVHGVARRIGKEGNNVFHVRVLFGFELGIELGMEVVPSCEGGAVNEGHDWVLGC